MKLISTLFVSDQIEVCMNVQSRVTKGDPKNGDGPLVTRYRSKVGNESLIFNPTVAMVLRGRDPKLGNQNIVIPVNQIHRLSSALSIVYEKLQAEKLFLMSDGVMYLDKKVALECSRKIPLFRNTLVLSPAACVDRSGKPIKGVELSVDGKAIGYIDHFDALSLLDTIDHIDVPTFTLLSGVIDQLDAADRKTDYILEKLDTIEKLIRTMQNPNVQQHTNKPSFQWEYV